MIPFPKMMQVAMVIAVVAWVVLVQAGCATITEGTSQQIEITSNPDGANCVIQRGDLLQGIVTPAKINIPKSSTALEINCTKEGYAPTHTIVKSAVDQGPRQAGMFLGGGLSTLIDASSGARWKYPDRVEVFMETAR